MGVNLRAQYVIAQEEIKVMLENEPLESGLAKLATVDGEKTWRTKFAKLSKGSVVMWGVSYPLLFDQDKRLLTK